MTKTKKQLRAEAVERLRECRYHTLSDYVRAMLGWGHEPHFEDSRDALIDLLTDDDANDDSTPEKVVSGSEPCVTPESCRQYADQRKQGDDADCESYDSREKLEVDAERYIEHAADYAYEDVLWADETFTLYDAIIELLDRQAEIIRAEDEAYCKECFTETYKRERKLGEAIDGLIEQVDELTAERDELKAELIDERGELNRQINTMRDVMRDYRNERDHYRSKFGKCIDYADAIHALMDDEGMA